ncbi:MAG: sugar ABC transporter permease [Actinomycetota bacterium]
MRIRMMDKRARKRALTILAFLAPALLLFGLFFAYPALKTFQISLTEWGGIKPPEPTGFSNYERLIGDKAFWSATFNAIQFALIGALMLFPAAISMAWGITQHIKGEKWFRFIVFAPVMLSVPVVALMWKFIYHPTLGLINPALESVGLGELARIWLADPATALPAVILASVWHGIGLWVILLVAGFDRIPPDALNAARIDGANEGQVFRRVTLPLLSDLLRILGLLWVVQALQTFPFILIMTDGGPFGSTEVPATLLYRTAVERHQLGLAAAMGVMLVAVITATVLIINLVTRREAVEF